MPVDTPRAVDAPIAACSGYQSITGAAPAGATYKGVSVSVTWNQARSDCQSDGADLVVIDNATEAAAVAALVDSPAQSPYFWSGLFDANDGTDNNFVSVRGGPAIYLPWGSQQPSGGDQDCILVGDFGTPHDLFDFQCDAVETYVCECLP